MHAPAPTSLLERYLALVASGGLERDKAQEAVLARLQVLLDRLGEGAPAAKSGMFSRLFGRAKPPERPKGLYIWGEVGRGKTMLMDLFNAAVPARFSHRRVHFNAFMNDVHERIFRYRNEVRAGRIKGDDPIGPVAQVLADEASLLCFDEFSVTDIADAMILGRLFTHLFERGVTVVATSNVVPDRLYEGGLNRALFLPFVDLLQQHMDVVKLEARTDYRLEKLSGGETYITGSGPQVRARMDDAFERLTGQREGERVVLAVKGRELVVPQAAMGVARFSFDELCNQPRGAADFLALAEHFHTLVLDDVPVIAQAQRNEAKRFILLIDCLYDRGVKLVVSAAAEPGGLYPYQEGREAFEFQRTESRLIEMRSEAYLAQPHQAPPKSSLVDT
ncbi:cell division protein ZapE [Labrys miyagiensis]|uniref:Cell division protein ZapE n=1 Tax=Labrys miyagiensis TaxID=346912 RepID=A0ABQ6CAD3_9HYPH|nr:cell division protein ZapE [Labrys miyagiensis]GLS17358.1 cell division protein ZapE [Labrys miyagiensis]